MLGPAQAAQSQHSDKSENCPALPSKRLAARADFAIGEAQHPRNRESQKEQPLQNRLGNEHKAAGKPVSIQWEERPHAVVVGPIEEEMAERGDARG